MPTLHAFIPTAYWLNMLAELATAHEATLVFQRFDAPGRPAALTAVDPAASLAELYAQGGYELVYVALSGPPRSAQDWGFLDREGRA
ncbi:hypothetical protein ACSRUE_43440 [Sorangium sp. KYC3313]|uniref:hypothetical protein n=1 Tax=Sorangium sp. KYC3313 TaxID=3449740 RepID=UPI003F8C438B